MAKASDRRAAMLWFLASALSLTAAVIRYASDGELRWPLLAATVFLAAMGFNSLRRSKSDVV